jgi:hypothetical protein
MAFQPWEYRPDAGFAKGADLTGYTVVAVDGDVGHVEAKFGTTVSAGSPARMAKASVSGQD